MNTRNPNNNFLEEEIEYEEVPEDQITAADEVLEEIEGEIEEQATQARETMKALSEVEKRIEQANLYKAILNTNLFGPGSARPEIIKVVDREFKEFVMFRMEVLLGVKSEGQRPGAAAQAKSQFTDVEVTALKDLARRLTTKAPAANPTVNQISAPAPSVNQVSATPAPSIQPVQSDTPYQQDEPQKQVRMVKRVVKRTVNGQPAAPAPVKNGRRRSNNISEITGQDLSQAVSQARPPLPMPRQSQINAMNAEQAEKNARGGAQATGGQLANHINALIRG